MRTSGIKYRGSKYAKIIYASIFALVAMLFLRVLYSRIVNSFLEYDLLWFIPQVMGQIYNLSFTRLVGYFLDPLPIYSCSVPLKIYSYFAIKFLGSLSANFIIISLIVHFSCSALIFSLSKKLGLGERIGFFSALTYLTLFAHFHAYMWPMAFQHLIVVFFILLGLNLFLKTNLLYENGKRIVFSYAATLLVGLLSSFCRASVFILPAMILAHILFCSKNKSEMIAKYAYWLPLFIIYSVYPLIVFSFGDPVLFMFFSKANLPVLLKFLIMFSFVLLILFIIKILLNAPKIIITRLKASILILVSLFAIILFFQGGAKRLLIPYNLISPFMGIFASFVHPLQSVLTMNSFRPFYHLMLGVDFVTFLTGIFILYVFITQFYKSRKELLVFGIWYLICAMFLYLKNPMPSRYFIYLSPVFSIIFCSVIDYLFTAFFSNAKARFFSNLALASLFLILCSYNVLSIKLALVKARLINSYMIYDYARAANMVKNDLSNKGLVAENLLIKNAVPVKFIDLSDGTVISDKKMYNVGLVFKQVFHDKSLNVLTDLKTQNSDGFASYFFQGNDIKDANGNSLDIFSQLFNSGKEELKRSNYDEASILFKRAVIEKPFLVKFLLKGFDLSDIKFLTNDSDLRSWVDKTVVFYSVDYVEDRFKTEYISKILDKELDEFIQCFFYLSYIEDQRNKLGDSKHFFSLIRYLDKDFKNLLILLREDDFNQTDKKILDYINSLSKDFLYFPMDYYNSRFDFQKFIYKLAFKA